MQAIGVGLGVDLKTIEFQFGGEERTELPNMATLIKDGIEMKQWNFFVHYLMMNMLYLCGWAIEGIS